MEFGGAMFFTNYAMDAGAFARALEDRGFDSVWSPEHSYIPASRVTPFPQGGELPRKYAVCMDSFVS
jgi:alkanesulfonate monooxygenase SsuD/methylene tetrahydromethanopterin reductase-like flavin-dependent oxidoreductase (luciferase family)